MIDELIIKKIKTVLKDALGVVDVDVVLEIPQNPDHGNYATNVAMQLAKTLKQKPRDIAAALFTHLMSDSDGLFETVQVAGPGFLNFTLGPSCYDLILKDILTLGDAYGRSKKFVGKKALVEFVSANPTGPLHVGHGRGAVVGDTLAGLLKAAGYEVHKEYYVNDGGIQINTLGRSVWLRHQQMKGQDIEFPEDCYQGEYIKDIASSTEVGRIIVSETDPDRLIYSLGTDAGNRILEEIKDDLRQTGVTHDAYFFESSLYRDGFVDHTLKELKRKGVTYEQEGALWLKSTAYGDDKDRVLIKSDKTNTYLLPDIAYHEYKYKRGFDLMVNVFGADHAGYIARLKAALTGLGYDAGKLHVAFIQMVNLIKAGQMVSMSTRRATYETLAAVRNEVGKDVVRYFFLMRSHNAQLDFDVELAKTQSQDNPVYYVQYAHARICAIFRKAKDEGLEVPESLSETTVKQLSLKEERRLLFKMSQYPQAVLTAATHLEPHRITYYILELAREFQYYYAQAKMDDRYKIVSAHKELSLARLVLLKALKSVMQNAFAILGITAPETM